MKKIVFAAFCAASAFAATPAFAEEGGEARVELRGGVVWGSGQTEAVAGVAGGYDWDLGTNVFGGVEVSADKILASGYDFTFGASARLGGKLGEATKVYATGGYLINTCDYCVDAWTGGAGVQHKVGEKVYVKAEYRHLFFSQGVPDANVVLAGVGVAL